LAVEIRLFETLIQEGMTSDELANRCEVHPEAIRTLSKILAAQGWLTCKGDDIALTAFARDFFDSDGPMSARYMLELMATQAKAFPEVVEAMSTGVTPPALEVRNLDGSYQAFLTAVNNYLFWAGRELLQKTDLPHINSFIVGSMGVSFSAVLLEKQAQSRVTYGCLEHLVEEIPRLRHEFSVDPSRVIGMHAHTGEPGGDDWGSSNYDLVFLTRKMILEPSERIGEKFAKKAFDVLNEDGVAVFWEVVYSDIGPMALPRAMEAVFDLCTSPAARARSADEYRSFLTGIGFKSVEVVPCLGGQTTFLVARK
jgi:hypothetical protein